MTLITNLLEANQYAMTNNISLVAGYHTKRQNKSEECTAFFHAPKTAGVVDKVTRTDKPNEHMYFSFKSRDINLWNNIEHFESPYAKAVLRTMYVLSIFVFLPVVDWIIGYLRSDQEVKSYYSFDVDPTTKAKSPLTYHGHIVDYQPKEVKLT